MSDGPAPFIPLIERPGDDAHARRVAARAVFDRVAELYDAGRPGYPPALLDDLVVTCRLDGGSSVLEVGCGTGQLSSSLAPRVGRLHCIELGEHLAALATRTLSSSDDVVVEVGAFEDVELTASFDAVVSATAFHWIDPAIAYPRAASLLVGNGHLALLTNAHVAGGSQAEIEADIAAIHERLAPEIGPWRFPTSDELSALAHQGGDIAQVWTRVERRFHAPPDVSSLFSEPVIRTYPWLQRYDRAGYLTMLASQSTYLQLPRDRATTLLQAIGDAIDARLGSEITKEYLAILAVARRR